MKSGFVALMGRPNVGKSSLLNALVREDLAITSAKAQTTRNAILGIVHHGGDEIIFIDTPGIHKPRTELGSNMNKEAYGQAEGADVIYYLIDAKKGLMEGDERILRRLKKLEIPVFLIVNKIDLIKGDVLAGLLASIAKDHDFAEYIPISAKDKDNLDELLKTTVDYFSGDTKYYPDDYKTNVSLSFRVKEIIRQKLLELTNQEVPHLVAVTVDTLQESDKKVLIEATIVCNKDSHKAIIIGQGGTKLRAINMSSSKELKKLFGKKVYLSLFVKVKEGWMDRQKDLLDLGYGRYE